MFTLKKKKKKDVHSCIYLVSAVYNPSLQLQRLDHFVVDSSYIMYYKS